MVAGLLALLALLACEPEKPLDTGTPWWERAGDTDERETAETGDTGDTGDTGVEPVECPEGPDGDADGWTTEDGDCDDCDAITFPGAPELCDGFDQDCDGTPILPGGCAEGIDFSDYPALPGWAGTLANAAIWASPLIGGEGQEDLLYSPYAGYPLGEDLYVYSAIALFDEMPEAAEQPWPQGAALLTWPTEGTGWGYLKEQQRDHDGDGVREVVFSWPGDGVGSGAVFLVDVPTGDAVQGDYEAVSRAVWRGPADDRSFAADIEPAVDLDGDGLYEIAMLTRTGWEDGEYRPSRIYLARGRPGLAGELDPLDEVYVDASSDGVSGTNWSEWVESIYLLPDLDGDGGDELLIDSGVDGLAIGSGAALLASDGGLLEDLFVEVPNPDWDTWLTHGWSSPGDWDGDGIADLIFERSGDVEADDCVYVVRYPAPFGGAPLEDVLQQLCMEDATNYRHVIGTHDLDEDGLLDPIFVWNGSPPEGGPGWANTQFLVPTTWLDGGRAEAAEVGIRVGIEGDTEYEGLVLADLDDDGYPEFVESTPGENLGGGLSDAGLIRVLQGFPLPFDEW